MASLGSELADLLGALLGKEAKDWMKGSASGFKAPKHASAPFIEAAAAIGTKALPSAVQRTLGSKLAKDAWLAEAVSLGGRALAGGALPAGEAFALQSFAAMRSRPEEQAEASALGGYWGLLFVKPELVPGASAPSEIPEPVDNRKPFPASDGRNPFAKWKAEGRGADAMTIATAWQPMGVLRRTKTPVAMIAPVYAEEADWIREHGLAAFLNLAQEEGVPLFPARRRRPNVCMAKAAAEPRKGTVAGI